MPISKLLATTFLSLQLIVLAGCTLPKPESRDNSTGTEAATFFVGDIKGEALSTKLSKDLGLPESKTFSFHICLQDRLSAPLPAGHPFRIEEINKDLKTDEKGCLNWSEEVPFNSMSKAHYLEWNRKITATGLHKGSRTAKLAINPWSDNDKSAAVVNTETNTDLPVVDDKKEIQSTLAGEKNQGRNALSLNNIRIQSNQKKFIEGGGVELALDLSGTPQVLVSGVDGKTYLQNLTRGTFKVKVLLIHSFNDNNEEKHLVLSQADATSSLQNENLFIKTTLKVEKLPPWGQLMLGLEITSTADQQNIGSFQGVYLIGDYDQVKISGFLMPVGNQGDPANFRTADYINAKLEDYKDRYMTPKVEISSIDARPIDIPKEGTSMKQVKFNIKVCFKNGIDQKILRNFKFNVTHFRLSESDPVVKSDAPVTSDSSLACIGWEETVQINNYDCHRYLNGFFEIDSKELAMHERVDIGINPWEDQNFFLNLKYANNRDRANKTCEEANVLPTSLILKRLNINKQSVAYELDDLLNLTLKKKLRISLDTAVSTHSNLMKGHNDNGQPLRPGIYLLKLALVRNKDYYNDKSYISSFEKLIASVDGEIRTDMILPTNDLKAAGNNNTFFIELDPVKDALVMVDAEGNVQPKTATENLDSLIDRGSGLLTHTYEGVLNLENDKDSQELIIYNNKDYATYLATGKTPATTEKKSIVRDYINYGKTLTAFRKTETLKQADISRFAKNHSLRVVSAKNPASLPALWAALPGPKKLGPDQISEVLKSIATTGTLSPATAQGLCGYWFKTLIRDQMWEPYIYNDTINCVNRVIPDPKKVFVVEKRLFVRELGNKNSETTFVKGYPAVTMNVGNAVTLSNAHSSYFTTTKSINMNAGASYKFAEFFSLGITGAYNISWAQSDSTVSNNAVTAGTTIPLNLKQLTFQLNLSSYYECSIVRMDPTLFAPKGPLYGTLNPRLSEAQQIATLNQGLMICTGEENRTPITRYENYFILGENMAANGGNTDGGDARNRNFFIALRGVHDYQRLVSMMKLEAVNTPKTSDRNEDSHQEILQGLDKVFLNEDIGSIPGSYYDGPR